MTTQAKSSEKWDQNQLWWASFLPTALLTGLLCQSVPMALLTAAPVSAAASSSQAKQQVSQVVLNYMTGGTGGRSSARIGKMAIVSPYALVSWNQGDTGGQALLSNTSGTWKIITFGGGSLGESGLKAFGVPPQLAQKLWSSYTQSNH